jgi:hypothetical protein
MTFFFGADPMLSAAELKAGTAPERRLNTLYPSGVLPGRLGRGTALPGFESCEIGRSMGGRS